MKILRYTTSVVALITAVQWMYQAFNLEGINAVGAMFGLMFLFVAIIFNAWDEKDF